jgi:hypothetical protein
MPKKTVWCLMVTWLLTNSQKTEAELHMARIQTSKNSICETPVFHILATDRTVIKVKNASKALNTGWRVFFNMLRYLQTRTLNSII